MRTRVKVCGITNLEDAKLAVEAGADALGFVFYKPSPRYVSPDVAADIIAQLPPFVATVGLFVNEAEDCVREAIAVTQLDLLQFHGDETEFECSRYERPYFKAIRMKNGLNLVKEIKAYSSARGILLDAYKPGVPGGTGESFDWQLIPDEIKGDIILAGGLTPENVAEAITTVTPYAVDISGGVEASKGKKDALKIKRFFDEVLSVNGNE